METVGSAPLASAPLSAAPLSAAPLNSPPLSSPQLNPVPLKPAPLNAVPLNAVPLNAVPADTVHADGKWTDSFAEDAKAAPAAPRLREPAAREHAPASARTTQAPKTVAPAAVPAKAAAPKTPKATALKAPLVSTWVAAVMGVIAVIEALVIVALLIRPPEANAASAPAPTAPAAPAQTPAPQPVAADPPPAVVVDQKPTAPEPLDVERLAAAQRSGGVRFVTPVELKVLQGERVLGSTADGPIILTAGNHQVDLINTALGIRIRQAVTFRAGQIGSVNVTIPPGRLSANVSSGWAEVFIDNRSVGETPLANISVPVGEHEVVFRHSDRGERRQTVTVRADQPVRVTAAFDK
jgi:hypothetical protein